MTTDRTNNTFAASRRAFLMSTTIDELLSSTISLHEDEDQEKVSSEQAISEAVEQVRPLLDQLPPLAIRRQGTAGAEKGTDPDRLHRSKMIDRNVVRYLLLLELLDKCG